MMSLIYPYHFSFSWIKKIVVLLVFIFPLFNMNALGQEKTAHIQLKFSEENSKKYITAKVNELINDSIGEPAGEIDLFFYVQRTFSLLPIGEYFNTTDENGEVKVEFPTDLPGDSTGNVTAIIKLLDAEEYLDIVVEKTIKWGIPTYL